MSALIGCRYVFFLANLRICDDTLDNQGTYGSGKNIRSTGTGVCDGRAGNKPTCSGKRDEL